ncbi:CocE/NonD family hydrolase [Marinobacter sp. F4218]|uniref:CocE/NonD family hydrolase n=1 Tax=Marinobacter sp. F4218 TaxID=2862868 RepID=UPI001C636DDC|nr:CocE/NonD family hydrolase [Marinobacter sp. F4218]MBW7470800.1 CocE/NonD family hydrolase [Marinobacter sp. F4218]
MPHSIRSRMPLHRLIPWFLALAVAGCGGTSSDDATDQSAQSNAAPRPACENPGEGAPPKCQLPPPVSCSDDAPGEGGRSYPVMLTSASGETIAFQVLEPIGGIDCARGHPLVLHGHGFGGSRSTEGFENYREAGFAVISVDQRGFGESTGTVRVMDPEFEGRDLIQILDWAEANLDYLQYRNEPGLPEALNPNLVAGAIGGSYGGGFQLLLHGQDPRQRLDAMVPDITWYDLRYSLNPGNVIKTGWDLVLVAGGEAGSTGGGNDGLDPIIREILAQGATLNRFPDAGLDFFYYHSPAYRCTGEPVSVSDAPDLLNYQINPPAFDVEPTPYPKVDVLLTQGMKDTLFNFNDAWRNFECLKALGGDVRLLTHQTGHILPVEAPEELQPAEYVDPTAGLLELPGFQGAAGQFACGKISISDATLNWLEHHLQGKPLASFFDGTGSEVCLSLDDGRSISVPFDSFPAPDPEGGVLEGENVVERAVATDLPVASGYEAVATASQPPAALILGKAGESGLTLGGIPTARLTVSDLTGRSSCDVELDPYAAGCDPIVFVGLGKRGADGSRWQLIDDQIKPVRGLKDQAVIELVGVAESLAPGDELALLVYGFHPQYPASWSRDALVPFVNVEGTVQLAVLQGTLENAL